MGEVAAGFVFVGASAAGSPAQMRCTWAVAVAMAETVTALVIKGPSGNGGQTVKLQSPQQ